MKQRIVLVLACIWLTCALLVGCATPVTTAQPQTMPTPPIISSVPTATIDPLTLNVCKTCDVQQRRIQATVTH